MFDADGGIVDIEDFNGVELVVTTESAEGVIVVHVNARGLDNHTGRAARCNGCRGSVIDFYNLDAAN